MAHRDRPAEARCEAARSQAADDLTVASKNIGAFPRWHFAFQQKPHAPACGAMIDCPLHLGIAKKPAFYAPAFRNRPQEPRFNRTGRAIDVMTIKAKASLKTQRIPGAEANRANIRITKQSLCE